MPVLAHHPPATYFGAHLVHSGRVYYFGESSTIVASTPKSYPFRMGFINIYDQQETPYSCTPAGQIFNFTSGFSTVSVTTVTSATMPWITTGLASGPSLSAQTGKSFRSFTLTDGVSSLNFNEPNMANTYCPVVPNSIGLPRVSSTVIPTTLMTFDPDAASYPPQTLTYSPFTID